MPPGGSGRGELNVTFGGSESDLSAAGYQHAFRRPEADEFSNQRPHGLALYPGTPASNLPPSFALG
jgi:hypothetical protein